MNKQTNKQEETFHLLSQTHPFRFGLRVWRTFTDSKLHERILIKIEQKFKITKLGEVEGTYTINKVRQRICYLKTQSIKTAGHVHLE